jgi:hypothetical protein
MHTLEELGDEEVEVEGCQLRRQGQMFLIESRGPLGGEYATFFAPEGAHVRVEVTWKKGRFGERDTGGLPPLRHMKVLKHFGFRTISRRDGHHHPLT